MPVINTRKRKPPTASAPPPAAPSSSSPPSSAAAPPSSSLDCLANVSIYELLGATSKYDSDVSDSGSSHSGDFALRRMRRTAPARHQLRAIANATAKRRRVHANDSDASSGAEDEGDRSRDRSRDTSAADAWSSPSLRDEIVRLHATMDAVLGREQLKPAPVTPVEVVQTVHAAVRELQAVLTEPLSGELLALHTRATLEQLWTRAREAADHEMRAKLAFWKHKAQQLRGSLQTAVEASAGGSPPSPSPPAPLQEALDFVSTFYLLDMAPEDARAPDPVKVMAIATANDAIARQLQQLESQRLRETPLVQPLARSLLLLSQRPPPASAGAHDETPDASSTSSQTPTVAEGVERGRHAPVEPARVPDQHGAHKPPPLQPSGHRPALPARVSGSAPSAASTSVFRSATSSTASSRVPTPAAQSQSGTTPPISAKSLNLDARRRLTSLLESQLHAKALATPVTRSPATVRPSTTNSTPIAAAPSSRHGTASASHAAPRAYPYTAPPVPVPRQETPVAVFGRSEANTTSATVEPSRPPLPPAVSATAVDADDGSDSDISHSGLGCTTCGRNDSYSSLLLCDNGCEREFHTFCLQPPLDKIPEGDWYCPKCLAMENIRADSRIYSCSAALCNKITGTKYCSLHRCKFDMCLNRSLAGGFCRRHERYREPKQSRRTSSAGVGVGASDVAPPRAAASAPLLPSGGARMPAAARPVSAASATTPMGTPGAARPRLNTEQLVSNMRQMGIWLPVNITGGSLSKAPTPTAPMASATPSEPSSAVV